MASYAPAGYYLQPGWYIPAPRSAGNSPQHLPSSLPSPGIFIPSPPHNPVALPPSPGPGPVYPPSEFRARRHSFNAAYAHPATPMAVWPYAGLPPTPGGGWGYPYPYSWSWAPRPLPAPALHPLIDGERAGGHLSADLSAYHLSLRYAGRSLSVNDRDAPATTPGLTRIRIVCDLIPQWPIDISVVGTTMTPSRPSRAAIGVITVEDVLYAIHGQLHKQITHDDWNRLSAAQEVDVSRAYTRRYKAYQPVESQLRREGVKRIDFLGKRIFFRGLVWLSADDGVERLRLVVDSRDDS